MLTLQPAATVLRGAFRAWRREHWLVLGIVLMAAVLALSVAVARASSASEPVLDPMPEALPSAQGLIADSAAVEAQPKNDFRNTMPYYLNVVFFVPSDTPVEPRYQERFTGILNAARAMFKSEMERYGYPNSTLGLHYDPNHLVSVTLLKAQEKATHYPYSGDGAQNMMNEINAYWEAHPEEKRSDHTLVIMACPADEAGTGKHPDCSAPFFGMGKWAFALSYPNMDMKNFEAGGTVAAEGTAWIGGLIHELGHGLNLPHEATLVSNQERDGMSLMDAGNGTFGRSTTTLTEGSAARLNRSQVFQTKKNDTLYQPRFVEVTQARLTANGGNLRAQVQYNLTPEDPNALTGKLERVIVELDAPDRADYNRVSYVLKPQASNSFTMDIPFSELQTADGEATFTVAFSFEEGTVQGGHVNHKFNLTGGQAQVDYTFNK